MIPSQDKIESQSFRPRLTTRQEDNGIGVCVPRKNVKDSGAQWSVVPFLRHGASFTVDLPLIDWVPEVASGKSPDSPRLVKTNPSVLVVDDEEHIAELVDTVVRGRGLLSTCCTKGENALALMKQNEYDLLICDYHMPGGGGLKLMEWILESRQCTRVLVLSGDVVLSETQGLDERLGAQFLSKPFGIIDLVSAIDRILGK